MTTLEEYVLWTIKDSKKNQFSSPFFNACASGHSKYVKLLLDLGDDINQKQYEDTGFTIACQYGDVKTIMLLLESGVDINVKIGTYTRNMFELACRRETYENQIDVIKLLHDRMKIDNVNNELLYACKTGNIEVARLLVQYGGTINTPLSMKMCVQLLKEDIMVKRNKFLSLYFPKVIVTLIDMYVIKK
jgi:ankyrin repeat protein